MTNGLMTLTSQCESISGCDIMKKQIRKQVKPDTELNWYVNFATGAAWDQKEEDRRNKTLLGRILNW